MKNNFTIKRVREHWDKVASIYDPCNKKPTNPHFQRFVVGVGLMNLKPDMKVLNIWSRTGDSIPYLRDKCKQIKLYNHEASEEMRKLAKKKHPKEEYHDTDLENVQYPDNYFDYILCLETLEHSPHPSKLLKEFYRVLKPKGRLIMSLPPAITEPSYLLYTYLFGSHGEGPHKFISSWKVKKLIKQSKLKLIHHKSTLLIPVFGEKVMKFGEWILDKCQKTPLAELGVRHFYVAVKEDKKE